MLEKARSSEERTKREGESVSTTSMSGVKTNIPPPPLVVRRGHSTITYRPASFEPPNGDAIASYSLFVRNAAGHNVKVRVSDTNFPGTGEQVLLYFDFLRFGFVLQRSNHEFLSEQKIKKIILNEIAEKSSTTRIRDRLL